MATASTSKASNNILSKPPAKLEFQRIIVSHWQIHQDKESEDITQEEEAQKLEAQPDFSCETCYPCPKEVEQRFYNFFEAITKAVPTQYILKFNQKTIEIFEQYIQEEDTDQQIQLCASLVLTFTYHSSYWKHPSVNPTTAVLHIEKLRRETSNFSEPYQAPISHKLSVYQKLIEEDNQSSLSAQTRETFTISPIEKDRDSEDKIIDYQ
jgi:hypothetical protein